MVRVFLPSADLRSRRHGDINRTKKRKKKKNERSVHVGFLETGMLIMWCYGNITLLWQRRGNKVGSCRAKRSYGVVSK